MGAVEKFWCAHCHQTHETTPELFVAHSRTEIRWVHA